MNGEILLSFPVFFPMAAALFSYLIGRKNKKARDIFADASTAVEFLCLCLLFYRVAKGENIAFSLPSVCGQGLFWKLDGFRAVYGIITAFMWLCTTVFSREYFKHYHNRNRYYFFLLWTLGATVGVFFSADFFTTFVFFEMMSFTSYAWVAHDESREALRAAGTYLSIAVIGGLVMLMGLFLLQHQFGTLDMEQLFVLCRSMEDKSTLFLPGILLLFGFGAKAGMFPLHIWLPKAHPVAPAPASALLSGILTKSGVFGILAVSVSLFYQSDNFGRLILWLGVATMLGGAVLAVFSIDLKRILACSSMSQIGFILVGAGMMVLAGQNNALAVRGTFLHMVNHSLLKLVLFMAAGVVYQNLHKLDLNSIRGFARNKPFLEGVFFMGALGISGIPLWNGYISKTLLHESIVEYYGVLYRETGNPMLEFRVVEALFLVAGGFTVAYMMKLLVALCMEKAPEQEFRPEQNRRDYLSIESKIALAVPAVLLPVLGMTPKLTMDPLADMANGFLHGGVSHHLIHYFTLENLKGALISIIIGLVVYFAFVRTVLMKKEGNGRKVYVDLWPKWLDLEERVYRPVLLKILPGICGFFSGWLEGKALLLPYRFFMKTSAVLCRVLDAFADAFVCLLRSTTHKDVSLSKKEIVGTGFSYRAGIFADNMVKALNRTVRRKNPIQKSYVTVFAELAEETKITNRLITASLSFGLLLFCIGFFLIVLYLLL